MELGATLEDTFKPVEGDSAITKIVAIDEVHSNKIALRIGRSLLRCRNEPLNGHLPVASHAKAM